MTFLRQSIRWCLLVLLVTVVFFPACQKEQPKEEIVDIAGILPERGVAEITHGYPDFRFVFVDEGEANVSLQFEDKFIRIDGVEDEAVRERLSAFVLEYLENPNKIAEDKAKREAYYNKLPPKEKMAGFVRRLKLRYPDFDYEWVGLGEGNVKLEYGDNSLFITGVDDEGAREEIAHRLRRIQKEIDVLGEQDK